MVGFELHFMNYRAKLLFGYALEMSKVMIFFYYYCQTPLLNVTHLSRTYLSKLIIENTPIQVYE